MRVVSSIDAGFMLMCRESLQHGIDERDWSVLSKMCRPRIQFLCDCAGFDYNDYMKLMQSFKNEDMKAEEERRRIENEKKAMRMARLFGIK